MQLVVNTFLHLTPKPFLLRRTCLVRVFANRIWDHRIRHGRGIAVPTHRSNRIFVRIRVKPGEPIHSCTHYLIHPFKIIHPVRSTNSFMHTHTHFIITGGQHIKQGCIYTKYANTYIMQSCICFRALRLIPVWALSRGVPSASRGRGCQLAPRRRPEAAWQCQVRWLRARTSI